MANDSASRPTYRVGLPQRIWNTLMKTLIRVGFKPDTTYILSVPGRKTGKVLERLSYPRPYFDNPPDAPAPAFASEAHRHPVFLLG